MIHLVIGGLCTAVGFAAGAFASHAAGEEDRAKAQHLNHVNSELIKNRESLQQKYNQLSDKSKETVGVLEQKLLESELEKDALYLIIRLQSGLLLLMHGIDRTPTFEVLLDFQQAVNQTNEVLGMLGEELIPLPKDYFSRNLNRAKVKLARQGLIPNAEQMTILKEILLSSGDGIIYCPSCGEKNAVMKRVNEIRCNECRDFIDLITHQNLIHWNDTTNLLLASQ